jgi:hypothetical protein
LDAARVALSHGRFRSSHLFNRRGIDGHAAEKREIVEAIEEGVHIHELMDPVYFEGRAGVEGLSASA